MARSFTGWLHPEANSVISVDMKRLICSLFLAWLVATAAAAPKIDAFFSPQGGCTEAAIKALDRATNSVLAQAYSFSSAPIAKALADAHKRGVKIRVILDKSQ